MKTLKLVLLISFFSIHAQANLCHKIFSTELLKSKQFLQVYKELKQRDLLTEQIEAEMLEVFSTIYLPMKKGQQPKIIGREDKPLTELEKLLLIQFKLLDNKVGLEAALEKLIQSPKLKPLVENIPTEQKAFLVGELSKAIRAQFEILGFESGTRLMDWQANGKKVKKLGQAMRDSFQQKLNSHKNPNSPMAGSEIMKEVLSENFKLRWVKSNSAKLQYENTQAYRKRKELIKEARKSIFINMWSIYDDMSGAQIRNLLIKAAKKGVEVKIIVDGNVSLKPGHNRVLESLNRHANISVLRYHAKNNKAFGYHIKTMIVDGEHLLTGGRNIGDYYTSINPKKSKWIDTDVYDRGDIAVVAESIFRNTWKENSTELIRTKEKQIASSAKTAAMTTYFEQKAGSSELMDMMIASIYMAEFEVNISNAYVIFTPALKEALKDALKRKVKVRIFTNSPKSVDEPVVSVPILKTAKELADMGAEVFLKNGDTLHAKTMVIDRRLSFVSSLNFHPRSAVLEAEGSYISLDPVFAAQFVNVFARDYQPINSYMLRADADLKIPYNVPSILSLRLFYEQL
jgi:phosphatidylserine/phosphatidylglycerophosphate/cardiolipin synthase-like enzyme